MTHGKAITNAMLRMGLWLALESLKFKLQRQQMPAPKLTPAPGPYTREEILKELERELKMREKLYPERVANHEALEGIPQEFHAEYRRKNWRRGRMPRGLAQYQIGLMQYLLDVLATMPEQRVYNRETAIMIMQDEPGRSFTSPEYETYFHFFCNGNRWMRVFLQGKPGDNDPEPIGEIYGYDLPTLDIWLDAECYYPPHPKAGELQ